jgi:hypothetical protein
MPKRGNINNPLTAKILAALMETPTGEDVTLKIPDVKKKTIHTTCYELSSPKADHPFIAHKQKFRDHAKFIYNKYPEVKSTYKGAVDIENQRFELNIPLADHEEILVKYLRARGYIVLSP